MSEAFLKLFTREQFRIAGFVRSLIVEPSDAADVMQETSLALWRSFHTYDANRDFANWAIGVARHQVLLHFRKKRRDCVTLSESLMSDLADETAGLLAGETPRYEALRGCVSKLTNRQRELISDFYGKGMDASEIAKQWDRNVHGIYNALRDVRKLLRICIERSLREV